MDKNETPTKVANCSREDIMNSNEFAKKNDEAANVRFEAKMKRERAIERRIRGAMNALVRAYRPGQIRNIEVVSPAGCSDYRVQWLGDHGHEIKSPLMPKAEIEAWIRSVAVEGPCYYRF